MKMEKVLKHKNLLIVIPIVVLCIVLLILILVNTNHTGLTNIATIDEATVASTQPPVNQGERNKNVSYALNSEKRETLGDNVTITGVNIASADDALLQSLGYKTGSYLVIKYEVNVLDSSYYYGPLFSEIDGVSVNGDSFAIAKDGTSITPLSLTSTLDKGSKYDCVSVIPCKEMANAIVGFNALNKDQTNVIVLNIKSADGGSEGNEAK